MIATLQQQYDRLQDRMEAVYVDKLDGEVDREFFEHNTQEWKAERANIERQIDRHRWADHSYTKDGVSILELSQRAWSLHQRQDVGEKRRILLFLLPNSVWQTGRLYPKYRKPFDMLVSAKIAPEFEMAVSHAEDGRFHIWQAR